MCARPNVMSGLGVERLFGFSEEMSLGAVEGVLNKGVFGKGEAADGARVGAVSTFGGCASF